MVAPTRVVLEGRNRVAEVSLMNTGDKPATYRISLLHQRMDENGKLTQVQSPAPGERFADELIRFAPKQVILEPHSGQVVRIQLRLPAELESGEYRCNLLFRAVPAVAAPAVAAPALAPLADNETKGSENKEKGLSIKLTPIYGVSIPLIVRHGATTMSVTMSDLKLIPGPDGAPLLSGRFNREGTASSYGDLAVLYAPENSTVFLPVGQIKGVAVYAPNTTRNFALALKTPATLALKNGTFRVTYRKPLADGGTVLAEATLAMP
jgi:hypothetical protein